MTFEDDMARGFRQKSSEDIEDGDDDDDDDDDKLMRVKDVTKKNREDVPNITINNANT